MTDLWPFATLFSTQLSCPRSFVPYWWVHHTLGGTVCSLTLTHFLSKLSFRGNNIINNFVCEHATIVAVSCSDPYLSQEIILVSATFNEISSLMIILTFYVFISITEDAFNWGAPQSLLHLCLLPDRHYDLPRDHPFPLLCS